MKIYNWSHLLLFFISNLKIAINLTYCNNENLTYCNNENIQLVSFIAIFYI